LTISHFIIILSTIKFGNHQMAETESLLKALARIFHGVPTLNK